MDEPRHADEPREASPDRTPRAPEADDLPVGELVGRLSEQTSTLVHQEMRLAQAELREKGKRAGIGIGMFGVGGLMGLFGALALVTAVVLGLSTALPSWLSALIVAAVLLAAAGAAALLGKRKVEQAAPPAPEEAIDSVKRDIDTVKRKAKR